MTNKEQEIRLKTEDLQKERNELITNIFYKENNSEQIEFQDVNSVFLLRKIAELQVELNDLKKIVNENKK